MSKRNLLAFSNPLKIVIKREAVHLRYLKKISDKSVGASPQHP